MSRLRLSELHSAGCSVAALDRLFGREPVVTDAPPIAPVIPALTDAELIALLRVRASKVALAVTDAIAKQALAQDRTISLIGAFRSLRAMGYVRIKPEGFHECTAIGSAKADTLARERARSLGLHVITYRHHTGHMRERASNSVTCTCGWSVNAGKSGGGDAAERHLKAAEAGTLPACFTLPKEGEP